MFSMSCYFALLILNITVGSFDITLRSLGMAKSSLDIALCNLEIFSHLVYGGHSSFNIISHSVETGN